MSNTPIRVVIADDHTVVREGLTTIINRGMDMCVVAEAAEWPEAVEIVAQHRPGIALLDVRMPGLSASEGVAKIHQQCPEVGIVMLSAFEAEDDVYGVMQAGASGFMLKSCSGAELRECIRIVHGGGTLLAPGPAAKLAERIQAPELTDRQAQILQLLAEGRTNKEIGATLKITEGTVKLHVNRVFYKLGVRSRAAAAAKALQRGLARFSKSA
jgi:two-component system, NarL family, response regulator